MLHERADRRRNDLPQHLGVDFLAGAFGYDAPVPGDTAGPHGEPDAGTRVLWLDAFIAKRKPEFKGR